MGFFSTVTYNQAIQDSSWTAKAESWADTCRAPAKWVAAEIWGGGKTYRVYQSSEGLSIYPRSTSVSESLLGSITRVFVGAILAVPGFLVSIPMMSTAFLSEEIRLKHTWSARNLTDEEKVRLQTLINERTSVEKEKQGEIITCMLCSIVCMLCCLVCAAE